MKVDIIDADLLGRKNHRFPNLCCMKLASYYRERGDEPRLVLPGEWPDAEKIVMAKVFTDTPDPFPLLNDIKRGGTGYFFDKAPPLPLAIEHAKPDYTLYNRWLPHHTNTKFYTDYSIGYLTRGCFRKCPFCVNQKYDHAFLASPLSEFYDNRRKKICLLDDNFLSFRGWRPLLEELMDTGKKFQFKQGMDERVLDAERCELLFSANYDGDYIFAFDNLRDYPLIERKLRLIREYTGTANLKFYVLCGFEGTDAADIEGVFQRIELLFRYGARPYIMRYQSADRKPWKESKWNQLYTSIARWANQVNFCKKLSFREFCLVNQKYAKSDKPCAAMRAMEAFEKEHADIAERYFDIRFKQW